MIRSLVVVGSLGERQLKDTLQQKIKGTQKKGKESEKKW